MASLGHSTPARPQTSAPQRVASGSRRQHPHRPRQVRHPCAAGPEQPRAGPRRGGAAAASGAPGRQTVTERTPPPPPPEVEVKVVGFGSRGAQALSKLAQHPLASRAELWCLDVDRAALEGAPTRNTLLLPKDDPLAAEGKLSAADLARVVGRAASDAGGRGNINAGTDGAVTFVLAPAAAPPGGAATVLQAVAALRAAGHFTVAALTQPFGFEGAAKRGQAAELVAALRGTAHVVALTEQDVLLQAFGGAQMTVAEATDIADTALEHAVLCVLQAVQADEVLKSSRGALMWHGRDLRHFKRILPPPLQQLLSRPGTAVLGRGLAAMPAAAAHQMGAAQAYMHLASDAVRAAAESPFLEGALQAASGVLCCIDLPPHEQAFEREGGAAAPLPGLESGEAARRAAHLSAQAAAGALGTLSGPACQDFVLTAQPRAGLSTSSDGSQVQVEATLLVMRQEGEDAAAPPSDAAGLIRRQPLLQQAPYGVGPAVPPPPRKQPAAPQRLPSSSWAALSAVAGGKAAAPPEQQASPVGGPPQRQAAAPPPAQQQRSLPGTPNFFGGGQPRQRQQPQPAAPQQQAPPAAAPRPAPAPPAQAAPQQRVHVQRAGEQTAPGTAAARESTGAVPAGAASQSEGGPQLSHKATVGDYSLSKTQMTAQSLDMSPEAARWRQQQRSDAFQQRQLIVWEPDEEEVQPWGDEEEEEEGAVGLAALLPPGLRRGRAPRVDLKARMSSILSQDREDALVLDSSSGSEETGGPGTGAP